jgi:spoIIIJ-associated protein
MKENIKTLEDLAKELLSLMMVEPKVSVEYDKDGEVYSVDIDAGDATGLLIGKRGETLSSIQTVLGVLLKQKTGEWNKIMVNVGDYREKEEDYLKNLATSTAQRAKDTGTPQSLYNLKAWQRRIVHMALSEDKDVVTESVGEGEERYLIVKAVASEKASK